MDAESLRKSAKRAYKSRDFSSASEIYAKLIELGNWPGPDIESADRLGYATALTSQNHLDSAAVELERAVELSPNDPRPRLKHGEVLSRLGYHGRAVEQFEEAVRLEPGVADNHLRLAQELRMLGRDAEVRRELEKCLQIDPTNVEAQILRMERSLLAVPDRDGQEEEAYGSATKGPGHGGASLTPLLSSSLGTGNSHPLLIAAQAVALTLFALWVRTLMA